MTNCGFRAAGWRWGLACLLAVAGLPATAATFTVSTTLDSGPGSLRQAMLDALASPDADEIVFAATADGVVTLGSPLPELLASGGDLTLTGNGVDRTVIDGANTHRPFLAQGAASLDLVLRHLTVRNGRGGGVSFNGGAIYFLGGSLTLDDVELSGNASPSGTGGAIFASAAVTIENSLLAANRANTGGAFEIWDGPLLVRNTTVSGTVGNNTVIVFGGGANARARLVNTSVVGNQSRGLQLRMSATLSLTNSLLAGNGSYDVGTTDTAAVDLATSSGNVIGVEFRTGLVDGVDGNRVGVTDARVGPLGDYGGPTRTVPLLPGSPALNAGTASGGDVPATDQRGIARDGTPDAGAFESSGFVLTRVGGNGQSTGVGTPFADPLTVQLAAQDGREPVEGGAVAFAAPASGPGAVLVPAVASIGADGRARTTATANGVVGGPYVVTARVANGAGPELSTGFSLTNVDGTCGAFAFPYTLSGADNAARVAELRQAIECANANTTDDAIDLGGHALVFADAPYADAGANALPPVTGVLALRNGALERASSAPAFRFLSVAANGDLTVHAMQLRNGSTDTEGGAIRADGALLVKASRFEDNRAAVRGGAIATHAMTTVVTSRFERNAALDGAAIAGGDADAIPGGDVTLVAHSRFEANGDGASRSVIWNKSYFAMVGSLVAGNRLSAAGSSLLAFHDDTAVAELRNVTIADNAVQGELLSWATANVKLHNSIVWDNEYGSLGKVSPNHSIVPGAPAMHGNLDQPPGFAGPGDYRLDAGSPAIDAGDNSYGFNDAYDADEDGDTTEMAPDLALNPRPLDDAGVADTGEGEAPILDMGAYEYQADSVAAGITVAPTGGLVTTEAGGTATFTVVLDRYPAADVTLTLASSNAAEGVVAPASLSFTQADWNHPRTVTVTGMDDGVDDGDQAYTILVGAASSADSAYDGIDPPDVAVVNQDDDDATRHVGGTVIGLAGSGLVLSLEEAEETLAIDADGRFEFAAALPPGAAYTVSVAVQPHDPTQSCVVVNGSGTIGGADVGDVVVNCGASVTYAVGGSVSGLAGGSLVLQLNGGGDLAVSADGSYAFPSRLVDGAGYVVTVRTQPQGRLCTLANATGTVQGADVTDVDISCAPLQANLHLDVDDGHAFARYGYVRDYFVTLGNSGNAPASATIAATFSAAFDVPNVHWQCLGGSAGACGSGGSGGFSDDANVPANGSVTWIVSVPVLGGSNESEATFTAAAGSLAEAFDTDTLVVFRDGVDVPYGDGAEARDGGDLLRLPDERSVTIEWPAAAEQGIHVVRRLQTAGGTVEAQRLRWGDADFVRLLGSDTAGRQQQASGWAPVAAGAQLAVGRVAGGDDAGIVLLEGAAWPLVLPQGAGDKQGDIQ